MFIIIAMVAIILIAMVTDLLAMHKQVKASTQEVNDLIGWLPKATRELYKGYKW